MNKYYSLWIVPSKKSFITFSNIIKELSKKYDAPIFTPHLTLIGDVQIDFDEIVQKTEMLAQLIKPFYINFSKVEFMDEYFRCVFSPANHNTELMNVNRLIKQIINDDGSIFLPHISLLYGKYENEVKEWCIDNGFSLPWNKYIETKH